MLLVTVVTIQEEDDVFEFVLFIICVVARRKYLLKNPKYRCLLFRII